MAVTVTRYSERPELWENTEATTDEVWPEYNQHGEVLGPYWGRLFDEFPEYQFALFDQMEPQAPLFRVGSRR
jgi:hypothetical protein